MAGNLPPQTEAETNLKRGRTSRKGRYFKRGPESGACLGLAKRKGLQHDEGLAIQLRVLVGVLADKAMGGRSVVQTGGTHFGRTPDVGKGAQNASVH